MKPQIVMQKFAKEYRVYYEDTDAGGVVYYANYLKFFERARTDFLRHAGILQSELIANEKLVFVVRRCQIEYIKPAKLDDLLEVSVVIDEMRAASIVMLQEISAGGVLLSKLRVEIVSVDADGFRPKKIASELIAALQG